MPLPGGICLEEDTNVKQFLVVTASPTVNGKELKANKAFPIIELETEHVKRVVDDANECYLRWQGLLWADKYGFLEDKDFWEHLTSKSKKHIEETGYLRRNPHIS